MRDEVRELARLGATYLQLDAPHYPLLIDPATRAFYESQGWSLERWLDRGIELDNAVIAAAPGVTFGFHLCRGNQGSRWLVSGGYDPIAPTCVPRCQRRSGCCSSTTTSGRASFEPLREVPDDRMVVLGLVTTKSGRRETVEELERRTREAAAFIDLERLAISPQCGFATSVVGNAAHAGRRAREAGDDRARGGRHLGVTGLRRSGAQRLPFREAVTAHPGRQRGQ